MELSQGEKLILLALATNEDGKEKLDLAFIRDAILSGNTWALTWELSGVPTKDTDPEVAEETADILGMWSYIERSVSQLSPEAQEKLKADADPFNLTFSGFDGNHDEHYGVASFLINKMNRFEDYKGRALNSHTQSSLPRYRRMLAAYRAELEETGLTSRTLSAESILKIVRPNQ